MTETLQKDDARHAESEAKYPGLPLSDGEYVITSVRRHPIGILSIWVADLMVVAFVILSAILVLKNPDVLLATGLTVNPDAALFIFGLLTLLVLLLGYVGAAIYNDNRFFVTNESVIQHIRTGLFSSREQVIALSGVEDASFVQHGVLQYLLGYGSIRLSTVGDETTYRFTLVEDPREQLQALNDAVELFKQQHVYEGGDGPGTSKKPASGSSS